MKVKLDQVKVLNAWARCAYVMFGTVAFSFMKQLLLGQL